MARDYKSRANPGPKKQQTSGWTWFSAGLLVGLFTAGLIWLKFASPANNPQAPPQAEASKPKQATIKPKQVQKPLPTKPNFEFYTVLPEMEVVVPEPLPDLKNGTKKASAPVVSRTLPAAGTAYMLQMGSFRKHTDADRMKARLALLGIETEIQKVSINNQDTFHRVRSGPYRSNREIKQTRALLAKNSIKSLLVKLK